MNKLLGDWKFFEGVPDEETLKRWRELYDRDAIRLVSPDDIIYTVEHLPAGLHAEVDPVTGRIVIVRDEAGESEG
jgi:hypothetical protein